MKYILLISILCLSILNAKYVNSTGAGSSCSTAVNDALQNAVKQVAGAKIKSNTKVSMGMLESDKIFSSTDGLVRGYKEISKQTEAGYCEVTLKVNVLEGKVEDSLNRYIKNKSSMRMFNKTNFKGRSVIVLYSKRGMKGAFNKNSRAVQSMMDDIQDQLRAMEFDIVLEDGLEGMSGLGDDMSDSDALQAASMIDADAVVLATLLTSGVEKSGENVIIYSNALIKAYEPSTKRLFANVNKRARNMSRANSKMAIKDGTAVGAIKTAKSAVPVLVKKIVSNLSTGSKKVVKVVIKDISSRVQRKMRKALKNNEIDFKVAKRSGKYVVLEIDTTDSLTDFEDRFIDMWIEEKIKGCPETEKSQGSKIEFKWTEQSCE
jgi:hypothetical protein